MPVLVKSCFTKKYLTQEKLYEFAQNWKDMLKTKSS